MTANLPLLHLKKSEIVAWTLVPLGVLVALLVQRGTLLSNDSYQYLSVAENIATGHGASTSLPYFDVEIAHGVMPAPLTTFPPGYPVAIAFLHALGLRFDLAGGVVSALAIALTLPLIAAACRALGIGVVASRLVLFCFVANSFSIRAGVSAASDPLFTCLVAATVVLTLLTPRAEGRLRWLLPVGAGVALGLSYWVRYAALLLVPGLCLAGVARIYFERSRRAVADLAISLVGPVLLIGAGMYRNIQLTGAWKGGNAKPVHNPILRVAVTAIRSFEGLFFGEEAPHWTRLAQGLVVVLLGWALAVAFLRFVRSRREPPARSATPDTGAILLVAISSLYFCGMTYLGVVSVISYGTRMFFPMLPLFLLLLALPLAKARALGRRDLALVLVACAAYVASNASTLRETKAAPHELVEARLTQPTSNGTTVRAWLESHAEKDEGILASNGQATAYALHRPVVSLTDAEYAELPWDAKRVNDVMDRFHLRYVVLYPQVDSRVAGVQEESPLLSALVHERPADGFKLEAKSEGAMVFSRP